MSHVAAPLSVRFEHRTDDGPVLGIGTATPRLSWIVPEADPAFSQEAFEVELTRGEGAPDVVQVTSVEQVLVPCRCPVAVAVVVRVRAALRGAGMQSRGRPVNGGSRLLRTQTGRGGSSARASWQAGRTGACAPLRPSTCR